MEEKRVGVKIFFSALISEGKITSYDCALLKGTGEGNGDGDIMGGGDAGRYTLS